MDNKNIPAFPVMNGCPSYLTGMTLRDWFAGQALAGMEANTTIWEEATVKRLAEEAYIQADAMLVAREK